jgi:hypothetical protein
MRPQFFPALQQFLRRDAPRPCPKRPASVVPFELAPQDEGDLLHQIVAGMRIAHQSADERSQFALVAQ